MLFDVDGVITDTASLHQAAWTQLFDDFLHRRTPSDGENHDPFTADDYKHHVDGKPRYDGVRDFLASRGITLPWGSESDRGEDTVCGLGNGKQGLFLKQIAAGVPTFGSTVALVRQLNGSVCAPRCTRRAATVRPSWSRPVSVTCSRSGSTGWSPRNSGCPASRIRRHCWKPRDDSVSGPAAASSSRTPGGVAAGRAGGFGLVIGVDRSGTERERLLERGADVVIGELADVTVRAIDRRMSQLPDALLSFGLLAGVVSARRPVLFFDFDGTLSQIVDDPAAATLVPGADKALQSLAALLPGRHPLRPRSRRHPQPRRHFPACGTRAATGSR